MYPFGKAYPRFPVMPAFVVSKALSEDAIPVSSGQVAAFRLSRQHLDPRSPASSLARMAGEVAGIQAQVLSAAQIALWSRTEGLRVEDVARALWQDRTLVKTWCMRGSLHIIPSRDFAVFVRGCAKREARSTGWLAWAGVPMAPVERILAGIPDVLDEPLTRRELAVRISESLNLPLKRRTGGGWGKSTESEGLDVGGHTLSVQGILFLACMRGLACFGSMRGNEATFVRPDRWLPGWRDLPQEEAEGELLRRYLRAHGPATVGDFAQWTYLKAMDAREVWSRLADSLLPIDTEGRIAWLLQDDAHALDRAGFESPSVRLLPLFDGFLLGLKEKGHLVDPAHYKAVYRPQGWISPVVLVDGRVAGVWSHERQGRRLSVRIEPFRECPRGVRKGITDEADDLGRFLGADEVRVRLRPPRSGTRPSRGPSRGRGPRARPSRTSASGRG